MKKKCRDKSEWGKTDSPDSLTPHPRKGGRLDQA